MFNFYKISINILQTFKIFNIFIDLQNTFSENHYLLLIKYIKNLIL